MLKVGRRINTGTEAENKRLLAGRVDESPGDSYWQMSVKTSNIRYALAIFSGGKLWRMNSVEK